MKIKNLKNRIGRFLEILGIAGILNFLLCFSFISGNSGFLGNFLMPSTYANDLDVLSCVEKNEHEFLTFWRATIYSDGLFDGTIEPFNDVIFRNSCHTNDILLLTKEQNKIRSMIREEFLKCEPVDFEHLEQYDVEEIERLKKAFHEVTMEIYYVRNIIDYQVAIGLPFGGLNTQDLYDNSEDKVNPEAKKKAVDIYNEMFEKYVSADYSADEFNLFFSKIEKKYKDRVPGYLNCKTGSWAQVSKRWEEFQDFFTEDYAGLKESGNEVVADARDIRDEFFDAKLIEVISGEKGVSDFVGSIGKINVNGVDKMKGLSEIGNELINSLPEGTSLTQELLVTQFQNELDNINIQDLEAEMKSKFDVQYLYNSDQSAELFTSELSNTLAITDESFVNLANVYQGVQAMDNRQCSY